MHDQVLLSRGKDLCIVEIASFQGASTAQNATHMIKQSIHYCELRLFFTSAKSSVKIAVDRLKAFNPVTFISTLTSSPATTLTRKLDVETAESLLRNGLLISPQRNHNNVRGYSDPPPDKTGSSSTTATNLSSSLSESIRLCGQAKDILKGIFPLTKRELDLYDRVSVCLGSGHLLKFSYDKTNSSLRVAKSHFFQTHNQLRTQNNPKLLHGMATASLLMGEKAHAIKFYDMTISTIDSYDSTGDDEDSRGILFLSLYNRALLHLPDDISSGQIDLNRAVSIYPDNIRVRVNLAGVIILGLMEEKMDGEREGLEELEQWKRAKDLLGRIVKKGGFCHGWVSGDWGSGGGDYGAEGRDEICLAARR